jgi:hypothetical protein
MRFMSKIVEGVFVPRLNHQSNQFAFAAAWTVTGAMAAHLPRILEANGATSLQAITAGAFIGPAQVFARIVEASLLSRYHPLVSTRLACLTHSIGVAILAVAGGGASTAFAIFHGTWLLAF